MSIDRRSFLGGVAAAAVMAPAVAEAAIATPKPAGWQLIRSEFMPDVISTPGDVTLPPALPGTMISVFNTGDRPISVYAATVECLEPNRHRFFLAISENTWFPLIV